MLTPRRYYALLVLLAIALFPTAVIVYNHIGEDCFISFRYAEQWARGAGLVYNVGDRVEGYSNFLWVALIALFVKLGVAPIDSSRWLAVAAHAALVVAFGLVAMGGTQSDSSSRRVVPWHRLWLPLAAWLSPLIHYHTDRGLETVLFAVLPCVAGLALAGRQWLTGGILLAMAAITRPEGILYLAALTPLLMREMDAAPDHPDAAPPPIPRREILRRALLVLAPVVLLWGGQLLFRILYYGDWVPNTAVAKLGRGTRPSAGPEILRWMIASNGLPVLACAGAYYAWDRLPRRRRFLAAGLSVLLAALVYQIAIGSVEAVAYRYMIPAVAPSLLLAGIVLEALHKDCREHSLPRRLMPVLALAMVFWIHPASNSPGSLFSGIRDAGRSRFHVRLWEFAKQPDWSERWQWWVHEPIDINAQAGQWMREFLYAEYPQALLAADQMGALGYHASLDQHIIDLGGLIDREIARTGLDPESLVARSPKFLVLYARRDETEPLLPELRGLVRHQQFASAYAPRWELLPRNSIEGAKFIVYAKRDLTDSPSPEILLLGVTTEEFERWYRVRE